MSSYSGEYEAMRQRHRQAVAEKRLADRQEQIDAVSRRPSSTPKISSRADLPAHIPETLLLPAPPTLPEPEDWRPGARPGRAWLGHYADTYVAHATGASEEALLPAAVTGHTLVVGATRMGKTRLLLLLAGKALADGANVAAPDFKVAQFTAGSPYD